MRFARAFVYRLQVRKSFVCVDSRAMPRSETVPGWPETHTRFLWRPGPAGAELLDVAELKVAGRPCAADLRHMPRI